MYKIEITEGMEQSHLKYFKEKIVPKLQESINMFQKDKVLNEVHNKFIQYCLQDEIIRCLAIGKPIELQRFDLEINNKIGEINRKCFKEYIQSNEDVTSYIVKRIKIKADEKITYSQVLLDLFGYKDFLIVQNLLDKIESQVKIELKKTRYCQEVYSRIIEKLEQEYYLNASFLSKIKKEGYKTKKQLQVELSKEMNKDIRVDNFKNSVLSDWNAYVFVYKTNLRVCPYCNRQYITPIFSNNGKMRADLDHFLLKSKYPYFSMSLYNLVPACKFCNSSLKKEIEFTFADIHPYKDRADDYMYFEADILEEECPIFIKPKSVAMKEVVLRYDKTFKLSSLYNYHSNQVKELLKKRLIYSEQYIHNLYEANKELFCNEEEIKSLIIGYVPNKESINAEPMGKFRRDIAEQLKFIRDDNKIDHRLIEKIKKISGGKLS